MNHICKALVAMLAVVSLATHAQSGTAKDPAATQGIDKRQAQQQTRIDQGVTSGQLTTREAARLEKGQERIQTMEDKAKADGKVTAKERARLHKAQDVQSRQVAREKHDRQRDRNHDGKNDRPRRK